MDFDEIIDSIPAILGLLIVPGLILVGVVFAPSSGSSYDDYGDTSYDSREANAPDRSDIEAIDRAGEAADAEADAAYFAAQINEEQDSCAIKGNISYNSGEKIYHIPGDSYYDQTVINETYGERMFCSESEAQAAGWRHAYN